MFSQGKPAALKVYFFLQTPSTKDLSLQKLVTQQVFCTQSNQYLQYEDMVFHNILQRAFSKYGKGEKVLCDPWRWYTQINYRLSRHVHQWSNFIHFHRNILDTLGVSLN